MPYHVRALIFLIPVLVAGMALFAASGRWPMLPKERNRLMMVWLMLTFLVFMTGNYWAYTGACIGLLLVLGSKDPASRIAFFCALVMILPRIEMYIPGPGPIQHLILMTHGRMMIFGLLIPLLMFPDPRGRRLPIFAAPLDKYVLAFMIIDLIALSRGIGGTEKMRIAAEYILDVGVVYFAVSRNIRSFDDLARVMSAVLMATVVLSAVAVFETIKEWKPYVAVYAGLQISTGFQDTYYDWRGGFLRTSGPTAYPIIFGYIFVFGLAMLLALKRHAKSSFWFWVLAAVLCFGNFSTVSRGTWLGAGVMLGVYLLLTSRSKLFAIMIAAAGAIVFAANSSNPNIRELYELLPFTGSHYDGTIDYRRLLLENAIEVMKQNLWFGSDGYLDTAEMERMRQGQGIIDIVNSYLQYGLRGGLLLIFAYVIIFLNVMLRLALALRTAQGAARNFAAALLAFMLAHLAIIFTVSTVALLAYMQTILIAMAVAFLQIHKQTVALSAPGPLGMPGGNNGGRGPGGHRSGYPGREREPAPGGAQPAHFTPNRF